MKTSEDALKVIAVSNIVKMARRIRNRVSKGWGLDGGELSLLCNRVDALDAALCASRKGRK